jgi:hypothetical protein
MIELWARLAAARAGKPELMVTFIHTPEVAFS